MEKEYSDSWQVSRKISGTILVLLTVQTIGVIIWATRLDYRVQNLETSQTVQDNKFERLDQAISKISIIEERQSNIAKRLDVQTDKINQVLSIITNRQRYDAPETTK